MSGNTVGNSPKPISSWRISSWPSSVLDERERELWTMRAAGESFHEITLRLAEIGAWEALSQKNCDALEWDLRLLRIGRKNIATQIDECIARCHGAFCARKEGGK